jgi:hypothetical protein
VGQDEYAEPLVRCANFCRAEQACRRRVAHVPKFSQHGLKAEADMPGDVLSEDPLGAVLPNNSSDLWPEVTGIVGSTAFASGAEGLAGISGEDCVEGTPEGPRIKTAQVVPDWGRGEVSCALGGDEHASWPILPFNKGAGVEAWLGEHEAQIQASAACAEGQSVPGT